MCWLFLLLWGSFLVLCSPTCLFLLLLLMLFYHIKKVIVKTNTRSFFSMFYSRNFIISGFTFTSLIHFELMFVNGVIQGSNLIFLQVSKHYLLKKLYFPHWVLLIRISNVVYWICVYFWAFDTLPLVYISVLCKQQAALNTIAL